MRMPAIELRISDWSSDVCSSGLNDRPVGRVVGGRHLQRNASGLKARGRGTGGASGRAARGPEDPMSYDLAFRYSQALDPSALVMIGTTLHAIHAAITDCRNARLDLESDPALILPPPHLAPVCPGNPPQTT